jgi:subtilisin family serine protease
MGIEATLMRVRAAAILVAAAAALAAPGLARAETLVALAQSARVPAEAKPVAPALGIWSVPDRVARTLPGVLARGPNRTLHRLASRATDPLAPSEWWLNAVGADRATPPAAPGKPVAVIDTGVDVTQPEFAALALLLLNAQRVPARGEEYHGTAVASVIAAPADGRGMIGVYPGAALESYDVGGGTLADVIAGISATIQQPGPGVINLSVGFEGAAGARLLGVAIDSAVAAGWLVVAAAGNAGDRGSPKTYPADLPHVLTVAATDRNANVAPFSNRSPWTDIAAPGVGILAAVPTWKDPSGYATLTGTSFAAPIVSGAAAWLWTTRPQLDRSQVGTILRRSAHDIDAPGVDPNAGWGILDIPAALATPAPIRDPQEPNDDIPLVSDGGLFQVGTTPLVDAKHRRNRVVARLTPSDDPADVYRLFVPAGREVHARLRSGRDVRLALWGPRTQGIGEAQTLRRRDLLSSGRAVRTRSAGRKGAYYYLEATLLPDAPEQAYIIDVELSAAPSRPTTRPAAAAASSGRGR